MTDIEITPTAPAADAAPRGRRCPRSRRSDLTDRTELAGSPVVAVYPVYGMNCGHCASAVTRELSAIDGVSGVHEDLGAKKETVGSTRQLTEDEVRAAVDEAGYELVV